MTRKKTPLGWQPPLALLLCLLLAGCSGGSGPGPGTPANYVQVNEVNPLPTPTTSPVSAPTIAATYYTVQAGDTLGAIALKFDVTVDDLVAANNLSDPNNLSIGQKLIIPPRRGNNPVKPTAAPAGPTATRIP